MRRVFIALLFVLLFATLSSANDLVFYDSRGNPVAYTEDGENIYLYSGKGVAYFKEDMIYGFSGKHLGWFIDGWVRDHDGDAVFYTEYADGIGPVSPVMKPAPMKYMKKVLPVRYIPEIQKFRPLMETLSWSPLSGYQFFR